MNALAEIYRDRIKRIREESCELAGYAHGPREAALARYREELGQYREQLSSEAEQVRFYREQLRFAEESMRYAKRGLAQALQYQSWTRKLIAAIERLLRHGGTA